MESNVSIDI